MFLTIPYQYLFVVHCLLVSHKTTAATIEKHRKISALPQWPKMPLRLRRSIPITGRSFNAENRSWCTAAVPRQTNVQLRLEISWVSSHLKESQAFQDKNATFIWCTGPYMALYFEYCSYGIAATRSCMQIMKCLHAPGRLLLLIRCIKLQSWFLLEQVQGQESRLAMREELTLKNRNALRTNESDD